MPMFDKYDFPREDFEERRDVERDAIRLWRAMAWKEKEIREKWGMTRTESAAMMGMWYKEFCDYELVRILTDCMEENKESTI